MKPVIKYTFVALLLLASPYSYAYTYWYVYAGSLEKYGESSLSTAQAWFSAKGCSYVGVVSTSSDYEIHQGVGGYCGGGGYNLTVYLNTTTNCPTLLPYAWSDGSCHATEEPAPYTCSTGKTMFVEVTKDSGGNFPDDLCVPQSANSSDYCMVGRVSGPVITDSQTMNLVYATASESPVSCTTPDDVGDIVRFPFSPDNFTGQITEQDTFFSETSNTYSPPNSVCTSNGDGTDTCVTITSVTETILSGQGTTTTSDGTTVTQVTDTGTTTTKSQVTETIDDGNGTVQETTTITNTAQSGSQTQQVINGNDGSSTTTIIKPAGSQLTTQQTTVQTTNPDGTVTTSSNSTTKTADGQTADPNPDASAEGNCGAPNQPPCEISLGDEDSLGDPDIAIEQTGIIDGFNTFITETEEVGQDDISSYVLDNPFSLPSTGVCNPAYYDYTYHGETMSPMASFCEAYDSTLHPILRWFFYMLTLMSLYFIYQSTVTRTQ